MRGYRGFDNEQTNWSYEEGEKFLNKLHSGGRRFVPLVDSALYIPNPDSASDVYRTHNRGATDDLFIQNPDGSLYIGAIWPGYTVFPDWHHPKAGNFWANELSLWHEKVAYDGMWIDICEYSSFCVGSCGTGNLQHNPAHPPFALPAEPGNVDYEYPEGFGKTSATEAASASSAAASQSAAATSGTGSESSSTTPYLRTSPMPGARNVNHPPYVINYVQAGHDLAVQAISSNATHVDGIQEYDVHNLNGHNILQRNIPRPAKTSGTIGTPRHPWIAKPGVNTTVPTPLGHIPLYLRGGSILPMQEPALTTRDTRQTDWSLLTALGTKGTARGQLYLDDGESLRPHATVDFKATRSSLRVFAKGSWEEKNPLANVTILGVNEKQDFEKVVFNGVKVDEEQVVYNAASEVLVVGGLQDVTKNGFLSGLNDGYEYHEV